MTIATYSATWSNITFIFYIGVILVCYFAALNGQSKGSVQLVLGERGIPLWQVVVSLVFGFVKCFGLTGRDLRAGYYLNFISATSMSEYRDQSIEVGYRLMNVVVRQFTSEYEVFVFVVGVLSLYPVIHLWKKYQDVIDLPTSVLMYGSIFFVQSFSPIRLTIAASIALFAFDGMVERRPWKALMWIFIAVTIHFSALILIIPYTFVFFRMFNRRLVMVGLLAIFLVGYSGRGSLISMMSGSERYYIYGVSQTVDIGMEQFIYYIPLFLILYLGRKYVEDRHIQMIAFSMVGVAFVFGLLSYIVPIFGRFRDIFVPLVFVVPFYIKRIKEENPRVGRWLSILMLVYCLVRFYIFISQYYNMEDLMPYVNIFGWEV